MTVAAGAAALPKAAEASASISDETIWISESFEIAKSDVYKSPPIRNTRDTSTITEAYKDNAERIAKQQVALAGARLARLLNVAFR
jgi:hypothetical protein